MGLQWFRRGQRGSDGSDDPYDDEFDSELEPLRPVTLGGESGNLSRSGIQGSGLSDRGRRRSSGRRGWRSDSSVASGSRVRGCAPRRLNSTISWLRASTLTESIWIALRRAAVARTCA